MTSAAKYSVNIDLFSSRLQFCWKLQFWTSEVSSTKTLSSKQIEKWFYWELENTVHETTNHFSHKNSKFRVRFDPFLYSVQISKIYSFEKIRRFFMIIFEIWTESKSGHFRKRKVINSLRLLIFGFPTAFIIEKFKMLGAWKQ